ncbi:MAG: cardiolipin synthase ClsB [Betaproteobacteria bacterium]|nr:cardiolipin synthase ClsB [Betaproteobacteria bacterium]
MAEFIAGNRVTLLHSGAEFFPALISALNGARRDIQLETYIFADDRIGQTVIEALARAAKRGVIVRVIVDGFGARHFSHSFGRTLAAAGAHYLIYREEVAFFQVSRYRLRRLHRKLAAIDGKVAFIGGINIMDDAESDIGQYADYAVRVEGPVLRPILETLRRTWSGVARASFKPHFRYPEIPLSSTKEAGQHRVAFLPHVSFYRRNSIAKSYLEAIGDARKTVLMAIAYFFPGWRFRRALTAAARRGVCVTVLVQGRSDHWLFHYASRALYDDFMRSGVRIFAYRKGFLHAKVAVVDQSWATVGSSNIDPFSLFLAKESNLAILDTDFAAQLSASLMREIEEGAVELKPGNQSWFTRILCWLCYGIVRFVADMAGYGHWHRMRQSGQEPFTRESVAEGQNNRNEY